MTIFKVPMFHLQSLTLFGICVAANSLEVYQAYMLEQTPDKLNDKFHSMLLAITYANVWSILCFAFPLAFFAGKPKRRRLLWKWICQIMPCLKGPAEIQIAIPSV